MSTNPRNPAEKNGTPAPPVTILVADDHADMRLYLRRCLRNALQMKKVILEAVDGTEALALVRQEEVDLLITDVVMPGMDGFALCRAMRRDPRLRHVPILFVTGELSNWEFEEQVGDLGPVEVITKPFNADQLSAKVVQILSQVPHLRGVPQGRRPRR